MIPEGKFRAKARKAELGETSTGKEQVGVEFELVDGDGQGSRLPWYGYFTPDTTERTIESLRIAGWRGDDITDLSDLAKPDVPIVELVIEHEEYEGKKRARVRWVNRAGGLAMKNALAPDKKAAFAQRLRGAVAAVDQRLKQGAPATPPPPAGDIPF